LCIRIRQRPKAACQTQGKRKARGECQAYYYSLFFNCGLQELKNIVIRMRNSFIVMLCTSILKFSFFLNSSGTSVLKKSVAVR